MPPGWLHRGPGLVVQSGSSPCRAAHLVASPIGAHSKVRATWVGPVLNPTKHQDSVSSQPLNPAAD